MNDINCTIIELSQRWQRARISAIGKISGDSSEEEFLQLADCLSEEQFESLLKAIFLNSRNLGLSYKKAHNLYWEKSDFVQHLHRMGSPCFQGKWTANDKTISLVRDGCADGRCLGARYCQYWREALDGLVMGICEDLAFVRYSSINSGETQCEDVIYDDEASQTDGIWKSPHRWGMLPDGVRDALGSVRETFREMKVELTFLGLSENNIYYKIESKENLTCGPVGSLYRTKLSRMVKEKYPEFQLRDASPVAVYGEKT